MVKYKTKIFIAFLFAFITVICTTCKKYDEGGNSLFPERKIVGKKVITLYSVDGVDSLKYLEDSVFKCRDYVIDFSNEQTSDEDDKGYYFFRFNCLSPIREFGCGFDSWRFGKDYISFNSFPSRESTAASMDYCKYIEQACSTGSNKDNAFNILCDSWTIIKLNNKELWIKKIKYNLKYEVHFIEKN